MAAQNGRNSSALATVVPPRVTRPGRTSQPPGQQVDNGQELTRNQTLNMTQTVDQYLNQNRISDAVRAAVRQMGTFGTAHFNLIEMAMGKWRVMVRSGLTNVMDGPGQIAAEALVSRLDGINDYSIGFSDKKGVDRILELMINDVVTSSGCCLELVLDKSRMPEQLVAFPYDTITWKQGSASRYPMQRGEGSDVDLNIPTVFVADFHKALTEVYAFPMFEAALREGRAYEQFLADMRRAVKRAGHGRLTVTLDYQRIKDAAPEEVKNDPEKLAVFMEDVRSGVSQVLEDMEPEDAFVTYDVAKADMLKSEGEKSDYVSLMNAMSGNLATALKSNPSILGLRIEGSQSLSNTESLIYLKVAQAVRRPVEECMSRAITLGLRLLGLDVYAEFIFDPINLRPEDELAAFRTMQLDRDLRYLSLGFITDEEFSVRQGLGALPPGFVPKSGTMFYEQKAVDASKASPNDGAQERALQPSSPSNSGGASQ